MKQLIKPRIAVINGAHPLARGLVFDMPMFEGGGATAREIRGTRNGALESSFSWVRDVYGAGVSFPASTTARSISTSPYLLYKDRPFTWMALFKVNAANTTKKVLLHDRSGDANAYEVWLEFDGSGTNTLGFGHYNGATWSWATWTSGFTAGSIHLVFGIWNGTHSLIYADDDAAAKATQAQGSPPTGSGVPLLYVGNHIINTNPMDGTLFVSRIWNRVLTAEERLKLYANPWAIYRRPTLRLGKAPAVVAANNTNAVWFGANF